MDRKFFANVNQIYRLFVACYIDEWLTVVTSLIFVISKSTYCVVKDESSSEASLFVKLAAFMIIQTFFVSTISVSITSELEKILDGRLKEGGADSVVIIKADKGSKHGRVVEVMDMAKKIGFSKLAIAVQSITQAPEE